jgi:hypothetical protein
MKEIKIQVPEGKRAEWREVNGVQTLVLVEERPENVMDRVKTIEDACKELSLMADAGDELAGNILADYESNTGSNISGEDVLAYLMLRVIVYALNEGWQPRFTKDEYRWYPWYYVKSKEEVEAMSEEQRRRVVGRAVYIANANGGLVYTNASSASSNSNTFNGSRLAFKTEELAEYAGKQFGEVYARMILG